MKKSNKGFTLIELLVVVVLIGILGGISALSIRALSSTSAKSCAAEINSLISKCRVSSLSRTGDVYITIYMKDGKVIGSYSDGKQTETKTLSDGRAVVSYKVGTITSNLGAEPGLKLSFDRSTGGLKPQSGGSDYCKAIFVAGGGKTYTIDIASSTGNHSIS